jgi:DHA2 family multidrug resistance protein
VLPLTGWLSDYLGRKRYLTYSVILFTVASFGCGTSRTLGELVFWRVLQGAGGAAFLSTAQATLLEIYPKELQGMATGIFGIGVVMAPTLGPTVGGIITDQASWPWVFFVNVPIGIVAAALTMLFVPNSLSAGVRRNADFVGIGFLALGLGCLQTILERGERDQWFQAGYIVWLTVLSVVGLVSFVWWEMRPANHNPAVRLNILANRNLLGGSIFAFALGFMLYGAIFALPPFLQNVEGRTAAQTGLLLLPGGLATGVMMPIIGSLVRRVDARLMIGTGMSILAIAMFQFQFRITPTTPDSALYLPLVLRGASLGLQFVPLSLVALGTLRPNQVAEGAGLFNLARQLGGSFGIAILASLLDRRQSFHYARLVENLSAYDLGTQQRLSQIQSGLMQRGMGEFDAHNAAYRTLSGAANGQAAVMSYVDIFHVMGYICVASLLLLFLLQRARQTPVAAAH